MTKRRTFWMGEEPEPNPVTQIIVARTLQTVAVAVPLLLGLRRTLPSDRFKRLLRWCGTLAAAGLSGYFVATFHARSPLFSRLSGKKNRFITRLPASAGNVVAITFDDGPHPKTTALLLDLLKQNDTKATFFLVGERVSRYPDLVRRIADEGHGIGIHGLRHRTMVLQTPKAVIADIRETVCRIEKATGRPLPTPYLLRPPYGFKTPALARAAGRAGCRIIAWSLDPRDYDDISPDCLVARVAQNLTRGSILLLHESPTTERLAQALPRVLALCRNRGFTCRALSEPRVLFQSNRR